MKRSSTKDSDNVLLLEHFHRAFDGLDFPSQPTGNQELVIAERMTAILLFADRLGVNRMESAEKRKQDMRKIYQETGHDPEISLAKLEQFVDEGWERVRNNSAWEREASRRNTPLHRGPAR